MLLRVTKVVILALFIQYIEGIDRVIVVSESDVHVNSYDEDILCLLYGCCMVHVVWLQLSVMWCGVVCRPFA